MDGELGGGQEESETGQAEGRGRGHGGGGVMLCADNTYELCATMFGVEEVATLLNASAFTLHT